MLVPGTRLELGLGPVPMPWHNLPSSLAYNVPGKFVLGIAAELTMFQEFAR